ncbi:MAG: DUF6431 domain-containing protein [Bacillota bacterium]|mgnify:CR=1 FL=1|jgi:transposase
MAIVQPGSCEFKVVDDRIEVADQAASAVACSKCAGKLRRWGWHWRMVILGGRSKKYRIRLRRMRCKGCGATHVIFPCFLAPYRRVITTLWREVVKKRFEGASLGRLAKETEFSLDTIRRWVRRAIGQSLQLEELGAK